MMVYSFNHWHRSSAQTLSFPHGWELTYCTQTWCTYWFSACQHSWPSARVALCPPQRWDAILKRPRCQLPVDWKGELRQHKKCHFLCGCSSWCHKLAQILFAWVRQNFANSAWYHVSPEMRSLKWFTDKIPDRKKILKMLLGRVRNHKIETPPKLCWKHRS